ncbi:MAG: 30S ribosomal protein S5 [Lachnospiraceae bacterium]|nr:30S ribosomal protein S5 [Lachnospiraceae bacterium]
MKSKRVDERQDEFDDNVVAIKRVTKVVKGGRNMRFAALIVVGDRKGHVGVGVGKAAEIPEAIRKAREEAKKKLITVPINEAGSVPYGYTGKFGSAEVLLKTAPEGTGIIAGGPARSVLDLAGYRNIRTKSLGSKNKQNVVLATLEGLRAIRDPEKIAKLRGKTVAEILK